MNSIKNAVICVISSAAIVTTAMAPPIAHAQRRQDWDWSGNRGRLDRLNAGTFITVRTTQNISADRDDARTFAGVVAEDVWDDYRRLAVPAIPQGSRVELVVRAAGDGDLLVDLDSVYAHGQRYALNAESQRFESDKDTRDERLNRDDHRGEYIGGGAVLGTIIGAIAGGGKGAAIGAATGAAGGLGLSYRGRALRVPSGTRLTFRLDRGLDLRTGNDEALGRRSNDRRR